MDKEWGQFHDAFHKTKINLINLSATLKKLNKNSETYNQHNYLLRLFSKSLSNLFVHINVTLRLIFFLFTPVDLGVMIRPGT